jgi:hypothetical protein
MVFLVYDPSSFWSKEVIMAWQRSLSGNLLCLQTDAHIVLVPCCLGVGSEPGGRAINTSFVRSTRSENQRPLLTLASLGLLSVKRGQANVCSGSLVFTATVQPWYSHTGCPRILVLNVCLGLVLRPSSEEGTCGSDRALTYIPGL